MFKPFTRTVLVAVCIFALSVGESQACCLLDCFKCCKPAPAACPAPAPVCDVCPQQVNYVPQTCYRTSYACVPCTTMKPVTTIDPCTGCPTTVMQPVTTFVRKPVTIPVTTMRPVATPVSFAPACSTCATSGTAYNSPYYAGSPVAAAAPAMGTPGCATCGTGSQVSYNAPMPTPAPMMSQPMLSSPPMSAPGMSAPMMSPTPAGSPPATFQQGTAPSATQSNYPPMNYPATPIPAVPTVPTAETNLNSTTTAPRLLDPQNRTTSLIGPATVTTAVFRTADRAKVFHPASAVTTADGWSNNAAAAPANDGWQTVNGK